MANMHPTNIEAYKYQSSEKYFYNELRRQLPSHYHVFFSIVWYTTKNGKRVNSECDFLVFNPKKGFITIEVKGGTSLCIEDDKWIIKSNGYPDRILKRSPFIQAEESMRYFKDDFEEVNNCKYRGVYGFSAAFPYYNINENIDNYDKERKR